jgi:hypothetical protein
MKRFGGFQLPEFRKYSKNICENIFAKRSHTDHHLEIDAYPQVIVPQSKLRYRMHKMPVSPSQIKWAINHLKFS